MNPDHVRSYFDRILADSQKPLPKSGGHSDNSSEILIDKVTLGEKSLSIKEGSEVRSPCASHKTYSEEKEKERKNNDKVQSTTKVQTKSKAQSTTEHSEKYSQGKNKALVSGKKLGHDISSNQSIIKRSIDIDLRHPSKKNLSNTPKAVIKRKISETHQDASEPESESELVKPNNASIQEVADLATQNAVDQIPESEHSLDKSSDGSGPSNNKPMFKYNSQTSAEYRKGLEAEIQSSADESTIYPNTEAAGDLPESPPNYYQQHHQRQKKQHQKELHIGQVQIRILDAETAQSHDEKTGAIKNKSTAKKRTPEPALSTNDSRLFLRTL